MKLNKRSLLTLSVSITFLILVFHEINSEKLMYTLSKVNIKTLLLIVPIFLSTFLLRGFRWKFLLNKMKYISPIKLGELSAVGTAINVYLPARIGDFYRAYFIGEKYKKSKLKILASVLIERIIDGITVLGILITATVLYCKKPLLIHLIIIAGVIFVGSSIVIYLAAKKHSPKVVINFFKHPIRYLPKKIQKHGLRILHKIQSWFNKFIEGCKDSIDKKNLLKAIITSGFIWLLECSIIYILVSSFGYETHFSIALIAISFIALSSMIPSTSIYIGPYQYAFILALGIYNISKSSALAIAFTLQSITIIILSAILIYFLIKNNLNLTQIKESTAKGTSNAK